MAVSNRNFRHAPPNAGAMIETLRGLGYSTAAAISDIIDNSISAAAKTIDLRFVWNGIDSLVSILDDGHGMDDLELEHAMRLGKKSPLDNRNESDLGRFGIGLKTASFSQCRRLTVASRRQGGKINCLCWDLDVLAESHNDGWRLLEGPDDSSHHLLDSLHASEKGTLVLWEKLDRIVPVGFSEQNFLDLLDIVEHHLMMTFHRYLAGKKPKLQIFLNGQIIVPWDPYLTKHSATWSSPLVRHETVGGTIEIQGYVLPHKDRLTKNEYDLGGGPDGWTAQQGFYVYRNQRLLLAGSWLGLGRGRLWTKEEAHRLARISLSISNSADVDWEIDIRKSTARPPVQMHAQLTRIAEDIRARARQVFAHRGKAVRQNSKQPVSQVWHSEYFNGGTRYRIDTNHPAIGDVLDEAGSLAPKIRNFLRIIEETVPVQRIWLDSAEGRETPQPEISKTSLVEVKSVLETIFFNMVIKKGMSITLAKERILHTEPFQNYPEMVADLSEKTLEK